jgi:hypothetical protein
MDLSVVSVLVSLFLVSLTALYIYFRFLRVENLPKTQPTESQRVMNEIYQTEKVYVKGLQQLRDYYIDPLKLRTKEGQEERKKQLNRKYALEKQRIDELNLAIKIYRKITGAKEPELETFEEIQEPQILDAKTIRELFASVSMIIGVNEMFIKDLENLFVEEKKKTDWLNTLKLLLARSQPKPTHKFSKVEQLADYLIVFGPSFKLYSEFISRFNTVTPMIKKLKTEN